MEGKRIKPDLRMYFECMPFIGHWIAFDYEKATSTGEMVSLVHKWLGQADETNNAEKKRCYQSAANYVYSWLTQKSFDSQISI